MAKKQSDLPGMEDRGIKELIDLATGYAEVRDQRQELTKREAELKSDLHAAMKRHKKREYDYEGIHVFIVTEEETVKVKIDKAKTEESKAAAG